MTCKHFLTLLFSTCCLVANAQLDTAGLIAHWTFDSTKADVTGNGHDVITEYKYQSGTPTPVYVTGVNDNSNTALQFRSNTFSGTYYSQDFDLDSTFSIATVLKFDTLSSAIILERKGAPSINDQHNAYGLSAGWFGQSLGFIPESSINFYANYFNLNTTKYLPLSYHPGIVDSTWYFVVMTYDNKYFKTYVNGALKSAVYFPNADLFSSNKGLYIGGSFNQWYLQYSRSFIGAMDDLRLYDRALPDSEIVTYPFEFFDTTVVWNMPGADSVICSGNKFDAKYITSKNFKANNVFTVQLSDSNGSFANPIQIGSSNTNTSGTINCTIPTTVTSDKYLVRILASAPADTSFEFAVNYHPKKSISGVIGGYAMRRVSHSSPQSGYCEGDSVIFAIHNMDGFGNYPTSFQWQINGADIYGAMGSGYTTDSLKRNDTIACRIKNGHQCFYNTEDTIKLIPVVDSTVTPDINIAVLPTGRICLGDSATFIVTGRAKTGTITHVSWRKNTSGSYSTNNDTLNTNAFDYLDTIYCLTASNATCALKGEYPSNKIIMSNIDTVLKDPQAVITATPAANVAAGTDITFTATLTDTGSNPHLQWIVNGQPHPGATGTTLQAPNGFLLSGNTVSLRIENTTSKCILKSNVDTSNEIRVSYYNDINIIERSNSLSLYPSPNKGSFTLKGEAENGTHTLTIQNLAGQIIQTEQIDVNNQNLNKQIELPSSTPSGIYIIKVSSGYNTHTLRFIIED